MGTFFARQSFLDASLVPSLPILPRHLILSPLNNYSYYKTNGELIREFGRVNNLKLVLY